MDNKEKGRQNLNNLEKTGRIWSTLMLISFFLVFIYSYVNSGQSVVILYLFFGFLFFLVMLIINTLLTHILARSYNLPVEDPESYKVTREKMKKSEIENRLKS